MTPAARFGAAIDILDQIRDGTPAEKALTTWARRSRFAGSKDRAAIRDHVFEIMRRLRSVSALGGGTSGRQRVLGLLRAQGVDPATVFTGDGHAPAPLTAAEQAAGQTPEGAAAVDLPDWLWPQIEQDLGQGAAAYGQTLQSRAPVMLRANLKKTTRDTVIDRLADEGILAAPASVSDTALIVTEGARKVANSDCYRNGLVELQDGASQSVVDHIAGLDGAEGAQKILDLCAGGGGKSLALAAKFQSHFFAYDVHRQRLRDLPDRARRAGVRIDILDQPEAKAPYDIVLCDVPCSGSGSWRRSPEGKWALTRDNLDELLGVQQEILTRAAGLCSTAGVLAYATCSVLSAENQDQISTFLDRNPDWRLLSQKTWLPGPEGDGFHLSLLTK